MSIRTKIISALSVMLVLMMLQAVVLLDTINQILEPDTVVTLTVLTILILLIAVASSLFLLLSVVKPMSTVVEAMQKLAKGNTHIDIDANREDELGDISRSVELFRQQLQELIEYSRLKNEQNDKLEKELTDRNQSLQKVNEDLGIHQTELEAQNNQLLETQQAMEQASLRYYALFNASPIAYCLLDAEAKISDFNATFRNMIALSARAIIGKHFNVLLNSESRRFLEVLSQTMPRQTPEWHKFEIRRFQGGKKFSALIHFSQYDADGELKFLLSILDNSDVEDVLSRSHDLEQISQAKSEFIASISHEIRTPLNGMLGMMQLLERTRLTDEQKKFLRILNESSGSLLQLINDVLDFSKIESGKMQLQRREFDLAALLKKSFSLFQSLAASKNLQFNLTIADNLPQAFIGDALRIEQVLSNLISNAIKFTEQGSVEIKADFDTNAILDESKMGRVIISVIDTGIGMSEAFHNQLFQRFSQEETGAKATRNGSGLGLAISRNLIELMGGDLLVETEQGKGSHFSFSLLMPLADPLQQQFDLSADDQQLLVKLKGKRVLAVDDNEVNRIVVASLLRSIEVFVDLAESAPEALMMIETAQKPYDLVFMDLRMPQMSGIEAARIIREKFDKTTLPVVALTGDLLLSVKQECEEAGMNDFLAKPIVMQDLVSSMLQTLGIGNREEPPKLPAADQAALPPVEELTMPDFAGINLQRAISNMNDMPQIYVDIASQFLKEYDSNCEQLAALFAGSEQQKAARLLHRLKGTFSQLGALQFSDLLKDLETQLKNADLTAEQLQDMHDNIVKGMTDLHSELRKVLIYLR